MATPTILFNNSTGSDSAASGAGPATALSGTNASFSGSVVTLDGSPDLTGVATDGSHVLWMQTSTGRQFFTINAKDNGAKTVTVDDAPAGTSTGRTWGIGGKRLSLDSATSRTLGSDVKESWIVELNNTGSAYTLSSTAFVFNPVSTVTVTLKGTSGRVEIQQTSAVNVLECAVNGFSRFTLRNLKLSASHASGGHGWYSGYGCGLIAYNVEFGDATNKLDYGVQRVSNADYSGEFHDCEFHHCKSVGIYGNAFINGCTFYNCWIHDNTGIGYRRDPNDNGGNIFLNCLFTNNGDYGVYVEGAGSLIISCTFYGNGNSGFRTLKNNAADRIYNNIFANNGGYGIEGGGPSSALTPADYNDFYSNTSGARLYFAAGDHDLTIDPQFTAVGSNDFSIGTNLKAKGFPDSTKYLGYASTGTISYADIGAAQRQEQAAGELAIGADEGGVIYLARGW